MRRPGAKAPGFAGGTTAIPVGVVVLLCSGLPLAWLVWQIVANPHVMREAWPDWFRLKLLGRTLFYNGAAAAIACAMGLPVGIVLGRGRGWLARALWVVLPVSLLLPSLAFAYGWSQFFRLMHAQLEPGGGADVMRCVWTLATWLWPIPAAAVGLALRRMDTQVQQQALLDGVLWRVTLRQLVTPIAAAFAVCAVLAVQEFAVYEPTGVSVVATETRMVFETGAFSSADNPMTQPFVGGEGPAAEAAGLASQQSRAGAAVATSLPLLLVIGAIAVALTIGAKRINVGEEIEIGAWPRALDAGPWLTLASFVIVLLCVMTPTLSLILSLKVHRSLGEIYDEFTPQILGSLLIASLAAALAMGLATWIGVKRSSLALAVALVTFLIGGQLIAIAQIRLYNRGGLSWIYNAWPIVVMAYLARFGWIALLAGGATWSPRWRTLRDLAAVDGATAVQCAARIVWPLAWPLLLAAGVLIMALSLTEVPATILLSPQRPPMLTPMLMTWVHMLRYDSMIEASLLLMATVAGLGLIVALLVAMFMRSRSWTKFTAIALTMLIVVGCDHSQPKAIWCETGTGPAQVVYPRAIAYKDSDDTFFVIDRMARVQQLNRQGQCLNEWRMPQWQTGKPVGISVGPDGNVYVPDTHYQRVMVYTPDGKLLRQWGSSGYGPGQFAYPTDIAFDKQGNVFVAEYGDNDRIQVFTPEGKYLYVFGKFGKEPGEFMRPQAILIDGDDVYVADACNHRLQVFKTDGTFVRVIGGVGSELGEFRYPYGLSMDNEGRLVVCEFGNNRVQLVDKKTGRGLKIWGSGGHEPGQLAYPWGVAVDRNDRVVAVDAGNNRLQVFEF